MKLIKTNRMVNDNELIIRHPETGNVLESEIDLDKESAPSVKYFNRLYKQGDLQVVKKGIKKSKGVE